ncbi:hypothetical protein PRIPAC_75702 [Pristionchus pacificus]|uniref:GLTP domain-containing protein n=2 Tax=Pristionchus pacificus TaxID=54126 RepID=A0A2A6C874_PRIPA|nr:hypothetical protein PRIPAC_75702 [Pristionchus pacificus]|eukprot:PDM74307.1 hypothetical protein PRIPAC_41663 [Pristionchus pacificus]
MHQEQIRPLVSCTFVIYMRLFFLFLILTQLIFVSSKLVHHRENYFIHVLWQLFWYERGRGIARSPVHLKMILEPELSFAFPKGAHPQPQPAISKQTIHISVMTCAAPANNHTDFAKKEHLFPCLQEDSGIPTEPFLSAFQGLADFVGFMGTAFAPVKSDIAGNVRTRWLKDPIGQDTLQKLIASDLKDNGGKLGIATEGLLWLKRGQEFMLLMLIFMVRDYRKDKASTESLVSYSKWPTMADPVVEDQSSSSQDEVLQIKTLTKKHIQVLYRLLILIVDNFGGGRKDLFGCEGGRREGTSTAEGRKEEREGGGWKERGVEECEEKRLEGPMGGEEKKV